MPAAIVFDMDGLLFDTEVLAQQAFGRAAAEQGYELPPALFLSMVGSPWPANRARMQDHYGPTLSVEKFSDAVHRHFNAMADTQLRLKPGVIELLDTLDDLCLPRAIATSSGHGSVQHYLAAHNLTDRFHAVAAQGDYAAGKPAPDPFLKAAKRLGVKPQACLALEDSHAGVRSASSAGMMTIMVPDLLQPTDEIRQLCRHIAMDLHEVRGLILDAVSPSVV